MQMQELTSDHGYRLFHTRIGRNTEAHQTGNNPKVLGGRGPAGQRRAVFVQELRFLSLQGAVPDSIGSLHTSLRPGARVPGTIVHRLGVNALPGPCPLLRRRNLFQQFAGALSDESGLVISNMLAAEQRALNFFVNGDEITDFFSNVVHVELPERGPNLHERDMWTSNHRASCRLEGRKRETKSVKAWQS